MSRLAVAMLLLTATILPAAAEWRFLVENREGQRIFQASRRLEGGAVIRLLCAKDRADAEIALQDGKLKAGSTSVTARFDASEVRLAGKVVPGTTTQWAPASDRSRGMVAVAALGRHREVVERAGVLTFTVDGRAVSAPFDAESRRVFQAGCAHAQERRTLPAEFAVRYVVYRGFDGAREQFGVFEKQADGRWLEQQAGLKTRNFFESRSETRTEVVLHDPARDLYLRLHIPSFRLQARFGPGSHWGDLYTLRVVAN